MRVLMLSPESPYPLDGGGAFRTASLLHYFARFADVDLIAFSQDENPPAVPSHLLRSRHIVPLPRHHKGTFSRYARNARRAFLGIPPLIDRFAGYSAEIKDAIGGRRYDFGIVEHFWCAPYIDLLAKFCAETVLDLHNIESVLHDRCAKLEGGRLVGMGHARFAGASRKLEALFLPRYSAILTTSEEDARLVREIAPGSRVHVYPNALPLTDPPPADAAGCPEHPRLVFSANFEYHPNIDAVKFLVGEIWPELRRLQPEVRLRLVGRNDRSIRHLLPAGSAAETGIEVTGAVEDARAEIAEACMVVAPLRAGSGTRVKILEAWSAARCVLATPLAAEGLDAHDGVNIALESGPREFAARASDLLRDQPSRARLAFAGRRTFERYYSWEIVWNTLDFGLQLTRQSGLNRYTGNF